MALAIAGCGKKGPPLAPLRLVPEPAANVTARRLGDVVYVQMTAPKSNTNGPGPAALDRLEVYAVTAAAGATPPNRELLNNTRVIAKIPIKPAPGDDEPPPADDEPKDTRPGPGDPVTFAEKLTDAELTPQFVAPAPAAATGAGAPASATETTAPAGGGGTAVNPATTGTAAAPAVAPEALAVPAAGSTSIGGAPGTTPTQAAAASPAPAATVPAGAAPAAPGAPAAAAPPLKVPARIYIVRGIAKGGRAGSPSGRAIVPLVAPPPPPDALSTSFNETAVAIAWLPPVAEATSILPLKFNVYGAPGESAPVADAQAAVAPTPLNPAPLDAAAYEHAGAASGVEQCFVVRTVETVGGATVEGEPSRRACVTPKDIFPPAAPKNLSAVAGPGAINLIWDANTEADLAGYVILRGLAPGDTLQPLNAEPTRDTRFRDTTVSPGARYVYAIVAVDRAGNRSAASPRVEEAAR